MTTTWKTWRGTECYAWAAGSAYAYEIDRMNLDADGAPNAYGPQNQGLDDARNAGWPGGWHSCLAPDPHNLAQPYVQASGPFAGFFVSKTSLQDTRVSENKPERYVDATKVPYIVLPGGFYNQHGTGQLGDFVAALNVATGKTCAGIVADVGPFNEQLGEVSLAMATALGGAEHPNPRTGAGAPRGFIRYVVFPGSHLTPSWSLTLDQINTRVTELLAAVGGWAAANALFTK